MEWFLSANLIFLVITMAISSDKFLDFEIDLLKSAACKNDRENVAISGFSVSTALALAYAGAQGQTLQEFSQKFGGTHDSFKSRSSKLFDSPTNYTLLQANKAFVDQSVTDLKDDYVNTLKDYYNSKIQQVNFAEVVKSVNVINGFVNESTKGLIKELVDENNIDDNTKLILVNALYFKAIFEYPFIKGATNNAMFYARAGVDKEVPTMHRNLNIPFLENEDVQVVSLPYKNNEAKLVIVVPKEKFGLDKVLKELTSDKLSEYINNDFIENVKLSLPKFSIDYGASIRENLQEIGFKNGFGDADFKGISESTNFKIGDVVHKVVFKTDETGTVAAAATGVVVMRSSLSLPTEVTVDHPFLFFTVAQGQIIFSGVVREIKD